MDFIDLILILLSTIGVDVCSEASFYVLWGSMIGTPEHRCDR